MHIYLVRHGQAVPPGEDPQRPLSSEGEKQVKSIAQFMKRKELIVVNEIWHSTKLRSKQTAEILAEELKLKVPLEEISGIEPDDDVSKMVKGLAERTGSVMIVGHMPYLGLLTSLLISGRAGSGAFQFDESSVACLVLNPGRTGEGPQGKTWALKWMISPNLI